jgi:hypothetical protein
VVAVKKREYPSLLARTLVLTLCLALPAYAQDAGVSDAPRLPSATLLDNGSVLLSPEAYVAVDTEMKRLQAKERDHALLVEKVKKDNENGAAKWVIPLIIGALMGAAIAVPVTLAVAQPAPK